MTVEKTALLPIALSKTLRLTVFVGLSFLSFAVPFSLGHSQILTGTLVNAALIASVILLPEKLFFPVILFPSLAVLSRGLIFGPFTPFLIYFLPFIWLGNLVLVWIFKKTYLQLGFLGALGVSGITKYLLLYLSAEIYFKFSLVPKIFLQTMGINQLITAILGGSLVFIIWKGILRERLQS